MTTRGPAFIGVLVGAALLAGCRESGGAGGEDEPIGTVSLAILGVPSTVRCIRVVTTGTSTVTNNLDVTPLTSSANLSLGRLPLGDVVFTGSAFDTPCAMVGTSAPSWIAEVTPARLVIGIPTKVTLNFRPNNIVTAAANFVQSAVQAIGPVGDRSFFSYIVMADGTVRASGSDAEGVNRIIFANTMRTLPITDVQTFAAAGSGGGTLDHYCFIKRADGSVWCGGTSFFGEGGPNAVGGGIRNVIPVRVPFPAPALPNARASRIATGQTFSCANVAVSTNGLENVFCWGLNSNGQLGRVTQTPPDNTANPVPAPVVMDNGMGVLVPVVAAGHPLFAGAAHACLSTGDDVQCWGFNAQGQVGDGTTVDKFAAVLLNPAAVGGTVSMGLGTFHTCAVRADGTMRCWGTGGFGALGEGNFNQRLSPSVTPSVMGVTDAVEVVSGLTHTCARRSTGGVLCWGFNDHGQVGDRTTDTRNVPVPVDGLSGVVGLGVGDRHSFAIMTDRSVKGWGRNSFGALGDGTRETRFSPVSAMTE